MNEQQMLRCIKSAGVWFVAKYGGECLDRIDQLNYDNDFKRAYIAKIYLDERCDSAIRGTNTRVYSLLKIINAGRINQAMLYVLDSRVEDEYKQYARAFLAATE